VLRTADGGASRHPQAITVGVIPPGGILAAGPMNASALIDGSSVAGAALCRLFFTTATGGDVSGTPARLTLSSSRRRFSKRSLRAAHQTVTVNGMLPGALGGEQIVVSRRNLSGGAWQHQLVVAGANGGSFTSSWRMSASSIFVGAVGRRQWAARGRFEGAERDRSLSCSSGATGGATGNRPARGRARRYLTVSVPYIPAARWPGAWQKNV
jgi:hypothetical protein